MTFELFKDFVKNKVIKGYATNGMIQPMFLSLASDMRLDAIPINDLIHLGKDGVADVLRRFCDAEKPMFTAHIAEANMLIVKDTEELNSVVNNPLLNPSVHPDKVDIVSISFCSKDGKRNQTVYRTINNGIETPRLELIQDYDTTHENSTGIFSNLI